MSIFHDFLAMLFPRNCPGCGTALSRGEDLLCTICRYDLPKTRFHTDPTNILLQKFYGRLPLSNGFSYLYFHKKGIVQSIMHHFKYENQPEIGERMGEWYGNDIKETFRPIPWDIVVPVPLHRSKEKKRGYNQSLHFAKGLSSTLEIPLMKDVVVRKRKSETQTHKSRLDRWENVKEIFELHKPENIQNKHVLLVDDVITTGATLESCGSTILKSAGELSVATMAIAR